MALVLAACATPPPRVAPPVPTTDVRVTLISRDKAAISAAMEVLEERLRLLGTGTFSGAAGDSIVFTIPTAELPDADVLDDVLHRRGVVSFLAWPPHGRPPVEGDPVPAGIQSLVDPETGITSTEVVEQDGMRGVKVVLSPEASARVAAFTTLHVNEFMPVALDGRILIAPVIQGPITGGELLIQLTDDAAMEPAALAAILASGPLPQGVIGR